MGISIYKYIYQQGPFLLIKQIPTPYWLTDEPIIIDSYIAIM